MPYFPCGPIEIAYLTDRDPVLGAAIERLGRIEREVQPDLWTALAHSLVSQQISNAAAATVWRRLRAQVSDLTPAQLASIPLEALRACGLPQRKAEWLHHIAQQVVSGALDLESLLTQPDAAVIQTLTALPGVGVWTAEMLLIFAMSRPDVVSWGDQAIRRGMQRLYGLEKLGKVQFSAYRDRYRPYGTVASFYLWALAVPSSGC